MSPGREGVEKGSSCKKEGWMLQRGGVEVKRSKGEALGASTEGLEEKSKERAAVFHAGSDKCSLETLGAQLISSSRKDTAYTVGSEEPSATTNTVTCHVRTFLTATRVTRPP